MPSDSATDSMSAAPTEDGTPISSEQLQSIIANTRQGLGASVSIDATGTGYVSLEQSFVGTADVDSGMADGQVSVGATAPRDRLIVDSTMFTRTINRWVAVDINRQGVPEGDVLLLWSVLNAATNARQKPGDTGSTISATLPATSLLEALGKSIKADDAGTSQRLQAAAKGVNASVVIATDTDGFVSMVTIATTLNVNGTPTSLSLHSMFSDYGQVLDVRKPIASPLYTPEGQ